MLAYICYRDDNFASKTPACAVQLHVPCGPTRDNKYELSSEQAQALDSSRNATKIYEASVADRTAKAST